MITLARTYFDLYTTGKVFDQDGTFLCFTLELPWRDNRRGVSCIPEGEYSVTKEEPIPPGDPLGRKKRPYKHFRVQSVPRRSGILFHRANHVREILGCIIPGKRFSDIDGDDVLDIVDSTQALTLLVDVLPNEFTLRIRKEGDIV